MHPHAVVLHGKGKQYSFTHQFRKAFVFSTIEAYPECMLISMVVRGIDYVLSPIPCSALKNIRPEYLPTINANTSVTLTFSKPLQSLTLIGRLLDG